MAASSGGGVLADVQRQLAAGWSDAEILAALTAKGLSPGSAERFLQRARPAGSAPPPLPPAAPPPLPVLPPAGPEAATVVLAAPPAPPFDGPPPVPVDGPPPVPVDRRPPVPLDRRPAAPAPAAAQAPSAGSRLGVIGGSLVMTLGLIALAWALGQERVRIRAPLALAVTGAAWMASAARGVVDRRRPATWLLPGTAAAPPALAALAVVGAVLTTGAPKPAPTAAAGADVPERRAAVPRRPQESRDAVVARHVARLQGTRTGDPCQAAFALAELGAREQVPVLVQFLEAADDDQQRTCAAYALVRLGEGAAMLPLYVAWSQDGSDQLVHGAIVGFGHVGPSAAREAVPILRDALAGHPTAARRFVIVSTLARLGPAAAPVLQLVVDDEDAQVRTAAQRALEKLR